MSEDRAVRQDMDVRINDLVCHKHPHDNDYYDRKCADEPLFGWTCHGITNITDPEQSNIPITGYSFYVAGISFF